jgi:hypothetical protein|tara:strand:+ start:141 stop:767 length:627 start_codon:yes stop_codon:yes gene_type:complete
MDTKQKELLWNRGLLLGLFLSIFPILDLMYGAEMTLSKYHFLFSFLWFLIYSISIIYIAKEFKVFVPIFDFKSTFRILFIVSLLAFTLLTVTKITVWNVFYPDKYVELNEARDIKLIAFFIKFSESTLNTAYEEGELTDDEYDDNLTKINVAFGEMKDAFLVKWNDIKENGLSKTLFIGDLVSNLFLIAIYNAIIAVIMKRKNKIVSV